MKDWIADGPSLLTYLRVRASAQSPLFLGYSRETGETAGITGINTGGERQEQEHRGFTWVFEQEWEAKGGIIRE